MESFNFGRPSILADEVISSHIYQDARSTATDRMMPDELLVGMIQQTADTLTNSLGVLSEEELRRTDAFQVLPASVMQTLLLNRRSVSIRLEHAADHLVSFVDLAQGRDSAGVTAGITLFAPHRVSHNHWVMLIFRRQCDRDSRVQCWYYDSMGVVQTRDLVKQQLLFIWPYVSAQCNLPQTLSFQPCYLPIGTHQREGLDCGTYAFLYTLWWLKSCTRNCVVKVNDGALMQYSTGILSAKFVAQLRRDILPHKFLSGLLP
jgi:hypothetical protein